MTYEYLCTACQHQWEAQQSISEAPLKTCPSCHQDTARRQVSGGAGFILKGGGWYADGYGSSKSSSGSSSASSEAKSETKSESKSETKPESSPTKPETKSTAAA
jgi:putative FmdB family regulatory protein